MRGSSDPPPAFSSLAFRATHFQKREHWLSPCLHPLLPADVLIWGSGAHVSDSRKWHRSAMGKYNIAHGRLEQNTNTDVKTELPDSR